MNKEKPITYSVKETAYLLGISRAHLYSLWQRGIGPKHIKAGGRTLVPVEAVDAWVKKAQVCHGR